MEYFNEIQWKVIQEENESIPAFILQTDNFDLTVEHLGHYPISPLPINLNLMRSLPLSPDTIIPDDKSLRVELAFEDPLPHNAFEIDLTQEDVASLEQANIDSEKIRFIIEGKNSPSGQIQSQELHTLHPWKLDWSGVLGINFLIRYSSGELDENIAHNLIDSLHHHLDEFGYASGIYTEMGILYRLLGDVDRAMESCMQEIHHLTGPDGVPGNGVYKAVNNLAVLYKRQGDFQKAHQLYLLALHYNPNHVESLLGIAGTINDIDLSLTCIAKAHHIRPDDPSIPTILDLASEASGISISEMQQRFNILSQKQNAAVPISELEIPNPMILLSGLVG